MLDNRFGWEPMGDQARGDRLLVVVLALLGAAATIVLSATPMAIGVDSSPVVIALVGSVNTFGYVALALLAAQGLLAWGVVSRLCLAMVAVSVIVALAAVAISDTAVAGSSLLVAMSSLMAFIILGYASLERDH